MISSLNDLFSISTTADMVSIGAFLGCILTALVMGFVFLLAIQYKSIVSKSFAVTIALLPAVVCVFIMMGPSLIL